MRRVLLVIPGLRPPSWNELYSGQHWSKRKAMADTIHLLVRAALDPDEPCFEGRVDIEVRAYFDKNPQDASNICGKILEDGLKGHLIADDGLEYVRSMRTVPEIDKMNPRVEIEIVEVE